MDRRSLVTLALALGIPTAAGWSAQTDGGDVLLTTDFRHRSDSVAIDMPMVRTPARPQDTEVAKRRTVQKAALSSTVMAALSERRDTVLRGTSKTIKFPMPDAAAQRLESVGSGAPGASGLSLVLDDVRLTDVGLRDGVTYDVYVNLPRSSASAAAIEPIEDHYLGHISSVALADYEQHPQRSSRIVIPLDTLVGGLRAKGSWSPDQLEIHFVQAGSFGTDRPLVKIGSAKIELGPKVQ